MKSVEITEPARVSVFCNINDAYTQLTFVLHLKYIFNMFL